MEESQAKSRDELTQAEEKVDHLNKVKVKLEVTLGELEDSWAWKEKSSWYGQTKTENRSWSEGHTRSCNWSWKG